MDKLIYANALKQRFGEREANDVEMYGVHIAECFPSEAAKEIVDQMPTVEAVEVVHAEWLDGYAVDHNGKKVYDSIDCSACEDIFKIESHDREYWKGRFKVCPFCGAKMDGGNEDG